MEEPEGVDGPSRGEKGGAAAAPGAPAQPPNLAGPWIAYVKGRKVADCAIEQRGDALTFILRRTPEERSTGRFLNATTVIAEAWRAQQGVIVERGNRIDWPGSHWMRNEPILPAGAVDVAGAYEDFVKGRKVADCTVERKGGALTFIIHRTPEQRVTGRYLDATTVLAEEWGPSAPPSWRAARASIGPAPIGNASRLAPNRPAGSICLATGRGIGPAFLRQHHLPSLSV